MLTICGLFSKLSKFNIITLDCRVIATARFEDIKLIFEINFPVSSIVQNFLPSTIRLTQIEESYFIISLLANFFDKGSDLQFLTRN